MKKRDIIIIVVVVAAALLVLLAARFIPHDNAPTAGEFVSSNTDNSAEKTPAAEKSDGAADNKLQTAEPAENKKSPDPKSTDSLENSSLTSDENEKETEPAASAAPTLQPAKAYLKIQVGNAVYDPIPLTREDKLVIRQPDGKENVVEVTEGSVKMFSANCDNQDCIYQGEITLENKNTRILQNMIICLPNHVVLELLSPEEARLDWESIYQD